MPTLTWSETKFYKSDLTLNAGKLYFTKEKIFLIAFKAILLVNGTASVKLDSTL